MIGPLLLAEEEEAMRSILATLKGSPCPSSSKTTTTTPLLAYCNRWDRMSGTPNREISSESSPKNSKASLTSKEDTGSQQPQSRGQLCRADQSVKATTSLLMILGARKGNQCHSTSFLTLNSTRSAICPNQSSDEAAAAAAHKGIYFITQLSLFNSIINNSLCLGLYVFGYSKILSDNPRLQEISHWTIEYEFNFSSRAPTQLSLENFHLTD